MRIYLLLNFGDIGTMKKESVKEVFLWEEM